MIHQSALKWMNRMRKLLSRKECTFIYQDAIYLTVWRFQQHNSVHVFIISLTAFYSCYQNWDDTKVGRLEEQEKYIMQANKTKTLLNSISGPPLTWRKTGSGSAIQCQKHLLVGCQTMCLFLLNTFRKWVLTVDHRLYQLSSLLKR